MITKKEVGIVVCEHVITKKRPVKMIVHHHDKSWEFMCGEIDHHEFINSKAVEINSLIKFDQSILPVKKLPVGCVAERQKINSKWHFTKIEE